MPIEQIAFVVADKASRLGQATTGAGVIVTERASVVLPVTVSGIPALAQAAGLPEVELLAQLGAVPIVVIDAENRVAVSYEVLLGEATRKTAP